MLLSLITLGFGGWSMCTLVLFGPRKFPLVISLTVFSLFFFPFFLRLRLFARWASWADSTKLASSLFFLFSFGICFLIDALNCVFQPFARFVSSPVAPLVLECLSILPLS